MVETESGLLVALAKVRREFEALQSLLTAQENPTPKVSLLPENHNSCPNKQNELMLQVANHLASMKSQMDLAEELAQQSAKYDSPIEGINHTGELLPQNELSYRGVVEEQTDLICRYRPDFTLTFVNRAYCELYQKHPKELIGANFFDLMLLEDREASVAYIAKLSAANPIASSEHRSLLPDGSVRWIQWMDRVILDENRQIVEYQGVGRDITERKLAEAAELERRSLTEALRDSLVALTSSLDVDTVMQHILEYAAHVVPYDASSIILYDNGVGRIAYSRGFSPEAQAFFKDFRYPIDKSLYADLILQTKPYLITDTSSTPDWIQLPVTGWIRSSIGVPIMRSDVVIGMLSVDSSVPNHFSPADVEHLQVFARYAVLALKNAYDTASLEQTIDDRTAELVAAKHRLEAILNNNTDGMLLAYLNDGIQQSNATFNTLFACREDEYFRKPLTSLVCDEYREVLDTTIQSVLATRHGKTVELRVCRADNTTFDAEFGVGYIHGNDGEASFVCAIRDISTRKRVENDLAEERNRLRTLIDTIPDFIYIKDLEHRFVLVNTAFARGNGYQTADEMIGKTDTDYLPHLLADQFKSEETEVFLKQSPVTDREVQIVEQDGRSWWAWSSKVPLKNLKGELIGLVGITRDITERKNAEQVLFDSAAELYDLYNNAPCGYYSLDANGFFVQINEVALRWLGYSYDEVINKLRITDVLTPADKARFDDVFATFKQRGWVKDVEFNLVCKDGSIRMVLTNSTILHDEHGNYVMSRSTLHDITKLKQVEKALRESEEKFRLMIESAPLATVITDQSGSITLVNKQSEILFGYEQGELIGKPIEVLLPETLRQRHQSVRETYTALAHPNTIPAGRDLVARRKDGSVCPVEIDLSQIETQAGKLVMSFIFDVSERKERERQLHFNASLQASVTDAVVATDMNFTIQSWNQAAERIYGWRADEAIGQNSGKLFKTRFGLGQTLQSYQQELLGKGRWQGEVVQVRKDETEVYILSSINLFKDESGNPLGVVGVNHDITARRQADEALQVKIEAELEFQIYLKALHEITIELTQVDQLNDFYRRAVELGLERLGFDRIALFLFDKDENAAIGTYGTSTEGTITDERHIRFIPGAEGAMMRAFQTSERFCFDEDTELHTALQSTGKGWNASAALWNGTQSIGWLVADNFIQKRPASKALLDTLALYAMSIGTLLARKQTDAALRESESRYRLLAENISDVIIRLTPVGEILYTSPSSLQMLGYLPEEMVGRSGFEFMNADDLAEPMSRIAHAMVGTAPTTSLLFRFPHKQGHMIWLEATGQLITSPETGELVEFIASLRDISERKRAEEAIRQALAKEKELGELKSRFVSMASHEFRTPLANILATTETLSTYRQKMSDHQIEERLNNVRGQVDHLKDIMDDVLQLARIQAKRVEFNPQPLNLDGLCREIVGEFEIRGDIRNQLRYSSREIPSVIDLDKKLMRQIINNLISNAVKYSIGDKPVSIDLAYTENKCILRVCDEGIGIPEADLKHLFEPFHRAANVGTISGTGLGLIITREAVELHGGTISIQSRVGIGTTITVEIPVTPSKEDDRGENSGD